MEKESRESRSRSRLGREEKGKGRGRGREERETSTHLLEISEVGNGVGVADEPSADARVAALERRDVM